MISLDLKDPSEKTVPIGDKTLVVEGKLYEGDLCDLYAATHSTPQALVIKKDWTWYDLLDDEDEIRVPALLKVVKTPLDNDLVLNETKILPSLFPPGAADEKFYRYFPKMLEHLPVEIEGAVHEALVVHRVSGHISLAEILAAFPGGVDFRDMVWMWKRVLVGVGFAHEKGIVHGAVVPPHVIVHPTGHGAKVLDWSYAVNLKAKEPRVRAMSAKWEKLYAPEIPGRKAVTPATDIYMSAKCALALIGGDIDTNEMPDTVPEPIQQFIKECLDPSPNMRPQNAWDLHEEFDKLLRKVVGKPVYRPFNMSGGML